MKLKNLDLNKLHVFATVADAGGVGAAAAARGRAPSPISQSVTGLERALGVNLFDRVGRRLVLTRGGQQLQQRLREYHAALQQTVDGLVDAGGEIHGQVRIGVYLGFPRLRLARFLARFVARHPRVRLRVVYAPQEDLSDRLLKNRLDVVLALHASAEASARIASTRLFEETLILVGRPRFLRRGVGVRALAGVPVVDYYQSDPLIRRWLAHHAPGQAIEPTVTIWAATTDLVLDLVLNDAGVAVLPRDVARPALRARRLVELRPRGAPLIDHIWLNERRGGYRDRTLTTFRDAVLRELA
jgi:DNA-binding transcriptional LysR family regulator